MTLTPDDNGTSIIRSSIVDQAALRGLLQKLRDLGITLISLTPLAPDTTTTTHACGTRNQATNSNHHHSHPGHTARSTLLLYRRNTN